MSTLSTQDDYTTLAGQLGFAKSKRFRAVLEYLMTPDQARMAATLPGTAAEVAEKTGFDEAQVAKDLDALFFKGVLFPRGDFYNRETYRFTRSVGQFHDSSLAHQDLDLVKDVELFRLWHEFCTEEYYEIAGERTAQSPVPMMRIVPSYHALKDVPDEEILPCEDFRELIKAQELIAVVPCPCRYRTEAVGEPCAHTNEVDRWNCIQFGRAADYVLARGSGKKLTTEEALDLAEECEKDGLIHIWMNTTVMTGMHFSCQCCQDCCISYVPLEVVGKSIGYAWAKTRFEAVIDQAKCDGCQDCVERCHFDAIEMVKPEGTGRKKRSKKLKALIDPEKCWGCGVCVIGCEDQAIGFKTVRPVEHIPTPA